MIGLCIFREFEIEIFIKVRFLMINFNSEECEFDKVRFCVLGEYEIVRFLCNVYEKCDIAGE